MKNIIVYILLFLLNGSILAQTDETKSNDGFVIYLVPQHAFNNGFRVDIEKQIKDQHWLSLDPIFYFAQDDLSHEDFNYQYDKLEGVGLGVYHKYILQAREELPDRFFYFNYGFIYKYFNINYSGEYYIPQTNKDGLEVLTEQFTKTSEKIHQYGVDITFGYLIKLNKNFCVDTYIGLGIRNANTNAKTENAEKSFNGLVYDYNYVGILPVIGFRIGVGNL